MNLPKYIIRSIIYYRRQHFGLFLGMAITAAVLTGALIVGDSIQHSLEKLVDRRLGKTEVAVIGGSRFIHSGIASELLNQSEIPASPVLLLKGITINPASGNRLNQATILGIDQSFNRISGSPLPELKDDEAVINTNVADRLRINTDDDLVIRVQSASMIPVNAPFSREPSPTVAIRLKVKAITGDDQAGDFNLSNSQAPAYNVFVNLGFLGAKMDLPGMSNILLVTHPIGIKALEDSLQSTWSLKDLGLNLRKGPTEGIYDLISDRIFIDTVVERVANKHHLPFDKIITYLVNDISSQGNHTPYSFATAGTSSVSRTALGENEVILNQWTADDLGARAGDSVELTYYEIGPMRRLHETSQKFRVREITGNTALVDSTLMPEFPGLSEAGNCSDWDAGVPIDLKKIRDKDEKYWDDYRGTPKVLLSLEKGEQIWKNPFGSATTLRFHEATTPKDTLASILLGNLKPTDIGIQLVHVRGAGLNAAENAVNFTELFLGMSFFIIAAGILLTVLIYSLHFAKRSVETAVLNGMGFSRNKIVLMRIMESSLVIVTGSIAGAFLGILYNYALIAGINTIWHDMVRMDMLSVHVEWDTIIMGALVSIMVAVIPVFTVTVRKLRQPVSGTMKGLSTGRKNKTLLPGIVMMTFSLIIVLVSLVFGLTDNAALYLLSGALFLLSGIVFSSAVIQRNIVAGTGRDLSLPSIRNLALSNLKRNPGRSIAVIALLAAGTFTVILTGSYRKTFHDSEVDRKSGTGGYLLWAETISPVLFDLNSEEGKERLILDDTTDLDGVQFLQFERLQGDDASCLNLNQAQQPAILSVNPDRFDTAAAFSFVKKPSGAIERPWLELNRQIDDTTFNAFADHTVLKYSLKKKAGDTLYYMNEAGKRIGLVIAGSLNNSIFQGNILISDKVFRKNFPSSGGSNVILADGPVDRREVMAAVLSNSLTDYGIDIIPAGERLAMFNSVENTYLSVFMMLSGLGLIIGTIGLGIVLLRNIHERRKEMALMLAMGYPREMLFRLVFTENIFLLAMGWGTGMVSAFVAILPSILSPSFDFRGGFIIVLTLAILLSGLIWIYFPLHAAMKKPLIPALRSE